MTLYRCLYLRPGEGKAYHDLSAKSDAEAKIRFLNLSWVAFTDITLLDVMIASDQPEAAKAAGRANKGKAPKLPKRPPTPPPRAASLTSEGIASQIDALRVKRAEAVARNDHKSAGALSEEINALKRRQHELRRQA